MRKIALGIIMAASLTLGLTPPAFGQQSAAEFFADYSRLSDQFDDSVVELYDDAAKIMSFRRYPHGLERAVELDGARYKKLLIESLPTARRMDDRSEFRDIRIDEEGLRATIRATRFSTAKCYEDTAYYMVIERKPKGPYRIVEEYSETQPQSDCGLQASLQNVVKQYEGRTPVMVDEETRLDGVEYQAPSTVAFRYTLVSVAGDEVDMGELKKYLHEVLLDQTCGTAYFQQLLKAGATVLFSYADRDGAAAFSLEYGASSCD